MSESGYRLLAWMLAVAAVIQAIAIIRQTDWPVERWIGAW